MQIQKKIEAFVHTIQPSDLVALNDYETTHPLRIDLVYAKPEHKDNIFKTAIYKPNAQMWGHRALVNIILRAAEICHEETGYLFEIKDCLRTMEAQQKMLETDVVRANPEWVKEPGRLLSPPGKGGHPRGMAVDIILIDDNGKEADMGTPFDYLTTDRTNNPAARNFTNLNTKALENRRTLEDVMMRAAKSAGRELLPLPQEWWDFRFLPSYTNNYAAISDKDLPEEMQMT